MTAVSDGLPLGWLARPDVSRVIGRLLRPATSIPLAVLAGALMPLSVLTGLPPFCPLKAVVGLPCPGCGITRSAVAFLHGDLATSWFFHPLGGLLVVALVVMALADAWIWWRSSREPAPVAGPSWLLERTARTPAPWIAIGALTIVWMIRLPLYLTGAWVY